MVCGFFFYQQLKSNGKFISAEPGRLVLNFLLFCIQHSLWGIQHIIQSSVTHTRHLLCLFSMLACNLQNYTGLILTNLKFATGHPINIVLKDRCNYWFEKFNVDKAVRLRSTVLYCTKWFADDNVNAKWIVLRKNLQSGWSLYTFYRYLKTEFKYPLHIKFNTRFVCVSM